MIRAASPLLRPLPARRTALLERVDPEIARLAVLFLLIAVGALGGAHAWLRGVEELGRLSFLLQNPL